MKSLDTNLYMQKRKLAFCSLNAMRTVCDYYFYSPPSRQQLKNSLKTTRKSGTFTHDIVKTVKTIGLKHKVNKTLTFNSIKKTIDNNNLILISYKSGPNQSHSSVISGYKIKKGIKYVELTDSWLGYYEIPVSILRVLFKKDSALAIYFKEIR